MFEIERISTPNQRKLVEYYNKLGFDKNEIIHKEGLATLSGIVGAIMWNIEQYHNRTIIDPDEENEFLTGGKRHKSKRNKSKRRKSKRKRTRKQL